MTGKIAKINLPARGAERVFFSLGSNLGNRLDAIERALDLLSAFCEDLEASRVYETEPLHLRRQPAFLNCAASCRTVLSPRALLFRIRAIEQRLGRVRGRRFGPRTIDIDILLFGSRIIDTPDLVIPHPRLCERRFVLLPLLELKPALREPGSGELYWKKLTKTLPGLVYFYGRSRYTCTPASIGNCGQ